MNTTHNEKFAMYDILDDDTVHLGLARRDYMTLRAWVLSKGRETQDIEEAWHRAALFMTRVNNYRFIPERHLHRWIEVIAARGGADGIELIRQLSEGGRPRLSGAEIMRIRLARLAEEDETDD